MAMSFWTGHKWWDEQRYARQYDNEKEAQKEADRLQPLVGPDHKVKVSRFTY